MRKLFLILVTLMMCSWTAMAQNSTYHGTVVDAETNEPLIGATVRPIGGGQGVATDLDGNFTLSVPQYVTQAEFSYVGYTPATAILSDNMTVRLTTTSTTLEDVMVVAFGTTTKEAFTGSASVVNADDLRSRTTANVTDALVGSVPGLQLRSSSGAPGSGNGEISIRGISSLYSSTQPLIIVDGAPYPESLSNISQDDIASISVLKDAASAALYGARGASGVVIITTKKGSNKEAEIKVNAKWGANTRAVQEYDVITDPGEYYEAFYAQIYNYNFLQQGMTPQAANVKSNQMMLDLLKYNAFTVPEGENLIGLDGKLNPNATLGRYYQLNGVNRYLIPDNFNDIAYQTGFRQEYNFSVNGGNEKSNFYASLSYLGEEGILKPSNYDRVTAQVRTEYQVKKWMKLGARVQYTHSSTKGNSDISEAFGAGNILYWTAMAAPIFPMYVRTYDVVDGKNGTPYIMKDANGNPQYDFGVGTYVNGSRPFSAPGNAVGAQALDLAQTTRNALNATLNATFDFTDYLKLDILSNVNWGLNQYTYYGSVYNTLNTSVNGKLAKNNTNSVRTNNSQTLTFYKYFGDHYLNVLAGHEYYRLDSDFLQGYAEGGFSEDILELFAFANHNFTSNTSYKTRYNVEGWFGSVQYNFLEKYYASASYRRDASSRFAKEHRWGDFWSVGAAWMMSKENFMEASKNWLDYLKIKFSIGQQGNDNLGGNYYWIDNYNLVPSTSTTVSPTFRALGNPNITWETTTNLNAGIEFGFFKNRLFGNIDVYNKNTSNLLFWLSIPESMGTRGYYGNMGTIRNTGVEIALTGTPIQTKDFEWSISANISTNKTRIVSLPRQKIENYGGFYGDNHWFEEGGELYNYMTYAFAGVDEHGQALYYYDPNMINENGSMITEKPANLKSKDYVTTETTKASRYTCGSILPKAFGGISTTARLKWFDVTLNFDYQLGGKVFDARYQYLMQPDQNLSSTPATAIHKDWVKEWSPNNTSSNLPRWQIGDQMGYVSSDRFLTNASYLNFASFVVGFTVPKFCKEIQKLRLYCAGENLCFWSARKGLDPRFRSTDTDENAYDGNVAVGGYSPMRTISGGVEITF